MTTIEELVRQQAREELKVKIDQAFLQAELITEQYAATFFPCTVYDETSSPKNGNASSVDAIKALKDEIFRLQQPKAEERAIKAFVNRVTGGGPAA